MTKTITLKVKFIAEGDHRDFERIVDMEPGDWFTIQEFMRALDNTLIKFGDITIPGTSSA